MTPQAYPLKYAPRSFGLRCPYRVKNRFDLNLNDIFHRHIAQDGKGVGFKSGYPLGDVFAIVFVLFELTLVNTPRHHLKGQVFAIFLSLANLWVSATQHNLAHFNRAFPRFCQ